MTVTRVNAEELAERFLHASGHATMPDDWTPVGGWIRVSGDKQDEGNQVEEVIKYAIQHEYWIVRWYVVHAKSAYKGEHQKDLDRAVEDMRDGRTRVLVIPHSNRLERREGKMGTELLNTLAEFTDAGGHVESVEEPMLGQLDMGSRILTYVTGLQNTEKSETISRETRRAYNRIDANRGVRNRVPWGYTYEGPKFDKHPVPTALCREYWPQVLQRCIAGESCYTIAAWLDSENVPTEKGGRWNQGTILHLIHNPTYCGRRLGWGKDTPLLKDEAAVPVDVWVAANEAIENRPKRGPIATSNRPMLAKLRCLRCGSPMYRKLIGGRLSRRYAYRCEGQGPQRKGCGNVVPYEQTEQIVVDRIFMTSTDPYEDRQWVSGWNYDAEIADLLKQLTALNPLAEDDEVRRPALIAQLREYQRKNEEEAITGGYERTWYLRENGRKGMQVRERSQHHDDELWTMGEEFDTLDRDQQREYLSTHHDIRVKRVLNPPLEPGASVGLHVVIDGADHGTFVFPPSPR
jgi:DNA invertase Pin-like site-specific DNA recombinase